MTPRIVFQKSQNMATLHALEAIQNSEIRSRNYMWNFVKSGCIVFELWSKYRNMHMCVQCCHILRFLKNNTRSHVLDQYVVFMQKGIKIGPVVSDRIVFETRIVKFVFFNPFLCSVAIFWKYETVESSEIRPKNYMWNFVKSGCIVFENRIVKFVCFLIHFCAVLPYFEK